MIPLPDDRLAELSLLTWNVNQWPSLLGRGRDRARLDRVQAALGPFDVVCLQECWSRSSLAIRDAFPHHYRDDGRSVFGFGSGLLTLSRFPILDGHYRRFENTAAPDGWAAKGVTLVRLWVPGFGPVQVVNTHLQAWRAEGVRIAQIRELAGFVAAHAAGLPTLLAGDLNAPPGSEELVRLREALGLRDLLDERPLPEEGVPGHRFGGGAGRIDHIALLEGGAGVRVLASGAVTGVGERPASDHAGLHACVRLEAGS